MSDNLTHGNPFKLILKFSLPIFAGNVFQQLYNMVDTVIVGRTVSSDAMAGVGSTGSITFLIFGLVWGLTAGFSVIVSQHFGANNYDRVKKSVAMSLVLCIALSVILTAVSVPLTKALLTLMKTPEQYFNYAYYYLFVVFWGLGATILYNITAGILRAVGDSKTPLFFLVLSAVLNIILDLVFIIVFSMHYIGAALATVLSQLISGIACLIYMLVKYPVLRPGRSDWKFDFSLSGRLIAVGLPMALQYAITAVGCIFQQSVLNGMNAEMPGVVTAYTAANKICNLGTLTHMSLGTAMATYVGQNYGAHKFDRIKDGVTVGMIYSLASWVVGCVLCFFVREPLMHLFIDKNSGDAVLYFENMMSYANTFIFWQFLMFPFLGAVFVYRNALQGMGRSSITMVAGILELVGRMAMVFLMVIPFGYTAVCLSDPAAWFLADIFLVSTFYYNMKKRSAKGTYTIRSLFCGKQK